MLTESGGIPGRQKVAHGSNVPALTSHASPNPRSKSGYEPERRVIKKDRPEAETRAEDEKELNYAMQVALDNGLTTAAAYILNSLDKKKKTKLKI